MTDGSWAVNMTHNITDSFFYNGGIIGLDLYLTLIFGAIGVTLFIKSKGNMSLTIGWFVFMQIFVVAVARSPFSMIIFVLVALMAAAYAWRAFFSKRY